MLLATHARPWSVEQGLCRLFDDNETECRRKRVFSTWPGQRCHFDRHRISIDHEYYTYWYFRECRTTLVPNNPLQVVQCHRILLLRTSLWYGMVSSLVHDLPLDNPSTEFGGSLINRHNIADRPRVVLGISNGVPRTSTFAFPFKFMLWAMCNEYDHLVQKSLKKAQKGGSWRFNPLSFFRRTLTCACIIHLHLNQRPARAAVRYRAA